MFIMAKNKFPVFWTIVLIVAVVWFLESMSWIPNTNIAWLPLILVVIAIGAIINRLVL